MVDLSFMSADDQEKILRKMRAEISAAAKAAGEEAFAVMAKSLFGNGAAPKTKPLAAVKPRGRRPYKRDKQGNIIRHIKKAA